MVFQQIPEVLSEKHSQIILTLMQDKSSLEYFMAIPLRKNNQNWSLSVLYYLKLIDKINREEIITYLKKYQKGLSCFG